MLQLYLFDHIDEIDGMRLAVSFTLKSKRVE